jgi:hypothetical protein
MSLLSKLRQARQKILAQMALLEEMRRGSVNRQFLKVKLNNGQSEPVLSGPYTLFTCKKNRRTVRRGLHDLEEIRGKGKSLLSRVALRGGRQLFI